MLANAAGYSVNEHSASSMGAAFAGRASDANDASVVSSNPAVAAFVDGPQISIGTAFIFRGGEFEGGQVTNSGTLKSFNKNFQKDTWVPFGHYVQQLSDDFYVGLSAYSPFGINIEYDKTFAGNYLGNKTDITVTNIQATFAWKEENTSIGFGLIGSKVDAELASDIGAILGTATPITKIEGDATTIGWNIGVAWQLNDTIQAGISYHSKLHFIIDGSIENIGAFNHDAKTDITMPERVMLGISQKVTEQWQVMLGATWTRWSSFEEFHVKDETIGSAGDIYVPQNWKNVWAFSTGTTYQLNQIFTVKAGYMYDISPVKEEYRTVRSPDSNRHWLTLGLNCKATPALSIDLSYAYIMLEKTDINEPVYNRGSRTPNAALGELRGEYKNNTHIIATQINYKF